MTLYIEHMSTCIGNHGLEHCKFACLQRSHGSPFESLDPRLHCHRINTYLMGTSFSSWALTFRCLCLQLVHGFALFLGPRSLWSLVVNSRYGVFRLISVGFFFNERWFEGHRYAEGDIVGIDALRTLYSEVHIRARALLA